jgi:uncharacterized surface protein with fasciclin (FAS1) repeats
VFSSAVVNFFSTKIVGGLTKNLTMITTRRFTQKGFFILGLALFAFTSCTKDDDGAGIENNNIAGIVSRTGNFSTLAGAVNRAELSATLNGTGPFTVFAPDNAAFEASGITQATLNSLTAQQAQSILLYHTLNGSVASSAVPAGPNARVTTASGDSVFVTRNANGVFVNGVRVVEADINATNGIIHRIGRVLMPPVGNIVETAAAPGSGFDSLVKAVLRANSATGGDPALANTLSTATITVFAPTNAAFTQLLTALNLTNIDQIPAATLLAVLRYHVVGGRAFSSDLANGNLPMLANGNTTVTLTGGAGGGPGITGAGNSGNVSNITRANIVARNGVIHVIDRVLLPQ